MRADVKRVEQYLRGMAVPSCASDEHRSQLRRQILGEVDHKRITMARGRIWKIATAAVILVSVGGVVGAVAEIGYYLAGRGPGGTYQFISKDSAHAYTISAPDANEATNVEQTARDLTEVDRLRRKKDFHLVRVIESEVNGHFESRTLVHRYPLPDGRTRTIGEGDPDDEIEAPLTSLTTAAWKEIGQLRQAGRGEDLGLQEKEVKGRAFVFQRQRYTLQNGTKVIVSVGEPKDVPPSHD